MLKFLFKVFIEKGRLCFPNRLKREGFLTEDIFVSPQPILILSKII